MRGCRCRRKRGGGDAPLHACVDEKGKEERSGPDSLTLSSWIVPPASSSCAIALKSGHFYLVPFFIFYCYCCYFFVVDGRVLPS